MVDFLTAGTMNRPPFRPRPFIPFQFPESPLYSERTLAPQNRDAHFTGREVALFGKYELTIFPNSNLSFKPLVNYPFTREEKCLLDNLWRSGQKQDTKYLIACLNSLCEYFNQKKKGFNFFVVFQGKQPGIYQTWVEVAEQIQNFPSPVYKGFHVLEEAFEAAKLTIGVNYYVTPALRFTKDNAVTYSVGKSTPERIVFCDHCQTLTNTIKALNEKIADKETFIHKLRTEMHQLQDKQEMMLSVKTDAELIQKLQLENSMLKEQCKQHRIDSINEAAKAHQATFIHNVLGPSSSTKKVTEEQSEKKPRNDLQLTEESLCTITKIVEKEVEKYMEKNLAEKIRYAINEYYEEEGPDCTEPPDDPMHPDGGYSETQDDVLDDIALQNLETTYGT